MDMGIIRADEVTVQEPTTAGKVCCPAPLQSQAILLLREPRHSRRGIKICALSSILSNTTEYPGWLMPGWPHSNFSHLAALPCGNRLALTATAAGAAKAMIRSFNFRENAGVPNKLMVPIT
jgi:hypothetical protein